MLFHSTKPKLKIREFASFIGTLISTFAGNQFDPLNYRVMLQFKEKSLKYRKGNLDPNTKFS